MSAVLVYAAVFAAGWVTGKMLWPTVIAWVKAKLGL